MSWYSPWLKRFAWPLLLSREGRGSALRHEAFLNQSQYWSRQKLQDYQWEKLREILLLASTHSPYYRRVFGERGLTVDSFKSPADLVLLPKLTRAEIFEHADQLHTGLHAQDQVMKFTTGGTSVRAATLYRNQESYNIKLGLAFRHEAWAGRPPGGRMLLIWPVLLDMVEDPPWRTRLKEYHLLGQRMHYGGSRAEEALRQAYRVLQDYEPSLLKVFPNSLSPLVDYIKAHDLPCPTVEGLISTGEPLTDSNRQEFGQIFGCPVFDLYASREVGHTSCECEAHDGRHIAMETSVVEFVDSDGKPRPAGERGDLLVTDLTNTAFPLIRYEIGDKGFSYPGACACGRELERMGSAVGRIADDGFRPDGSSFAGHAFGVHVLARDDIGEAQIIQRTLTSYHVLLTDDPSPTQQALEELRSGMQELVGGPVQVAFELVKQIPRERSGKKRYFKCELDPGEISRLRNPRQPAGDRP